MIGVVEWIVAHVTPRDGIIAVLILALFTFAQKISNDNVELEKLHAVYDHPAVSYVERVVTKEGPVRIRTVIVREKSGTETTTVDETREPVTSVAETKDESAPVPLSIGLKEPRSDRYLLTLGVNRLSQTFDGKALFVGYGWHNRFDLQVGGVQHNGFSPWLLATVRF